MRRELKGDTSKHQIDIEWLRQNVSETLEASAKKWTVALEAVKTNVVSTESDAKRREDEDREFREKQTDLGWFEMLVDDGQQY